MNPASILTIVNAPYGEYLDGEGLALCLKSLEAAKSKPGHVSSFFSEVPASAQIDFAAQHGINKQALICIAKDFSAYSGQSYAIAK